MRPSLGSSWLVSSGSPQMAVTSAMVIPTRGSLATIDLPLAETAAGIGAGAVGRAALDGAPAFADDEADWNEPIESIAHGKF